MIFQLLNSIFNSRPPQPRYSFTWDVSVLVNYIYRSLVPNGTLSLKVFTVSKTGHAPVLALCR